jgi:hydroxyethylthiazole kinase
MFKMLFENVQQQTPLVHCITNYVTVNDVANALLAAGGSPIMADAPEEVADITSICTALNLNIGTLNSRAVESMLLAGRQANALSHPVVLDPVGAGASPFRTETTFNLLEDIAFTVIKGNISEMKTIHSGSGTTKGVDADISDAVTEETLEATVAFAKRLADRNEAVIAITGAIDIVADRDKAYIIRNGHPQMAKVSGTGCMLSALIAAYCGANPEQLLDATAAAVCLMGVSGELAYERMIRNAAGTSSYRSYLIDEISKMSAKKLEGGAKIENR